MSDTAPDDAALDQVFAKAYRIRFVEHAPLDPGAERRTLLDVDPSEFASLREAMRLAGHRKSRVYAERRQRPAYQGARRECIGHTRLTSNTGMQVGDGVMHARDFSDGLLVPGPSGHCMCDGDMLLVFEDMSGACLASISLHHGHSLRWPAAGEWDAAFVDPRAFIEWLAARGVDQYAVDQQREREATRIHDLQRERWLAAMPSSLHANLVELEGSAMFGFAPDPSTLDDALARLERELGSKPAVACALLSWYGEGAGPWSGFPAYEQVPERLLARLGTDAVLDASEGFELELDDALLSGLARYFSSSDRQRTHRSAIARLPEALRERLLAHVRARTVGDNLQRLQAALASIEPARSRARASGLVCVHPDRAVSEVATSGGTVVAVEGFGVVRFVAGEDQPVTLLERRPMFASIVADERHVYAALINEGTIVRVALEGGEPAVLPRERGRPLWLRRRGPTLAWVDQPFVPDPGPGPPRSTTRTTICRVSTRGGPVDELATHEGAAWDLTFAGDRLAWVRSRRDGLEIASVAGPGGPIEPLITFDKFDSRDGFVHLTGTDAHLIVATPIRKWLHKWVALRRHTLDGDRIEDIDFVRGRFSGLAASERGIALIVERGESIEAHAWSSVGRHATLAVPRQPGPLINPHAAIDGVYFAVGSEIYRLLWP